MASGTTGVLATARHWCPLKKNAQKIAHTAFLALSLVSIAVSQLVFVFAATGLARDVNKSEFLDGNEVNFFNSVSRVFATEKKTSQKCQKCKNIN